MGVQTQMIWIWQRSGGWIRFKKPGWQAWGYWKKETAPTSSSQ